MSPCTMPDCPNALYRKALGLCRAHYARLRRYGSADGGGPLRLTPHSPATKPQDHDDGTRTCRICDLRKSLDDFPADPSGTLGRKTLCKSCHTAGQLARYHASPEAHREQLRQRRLVNGEAVREYDRKRYERDKDKRIALAAESGHRRRALLAGVAKDRGITVRSLLERHGPRCVYCRTVMIVKPATGRTFIPDKATIEHLIPLSKGGTHTWDNVRLACWQCNVSKNAKGYEEWLLSRGEIPLGW